MQPDMQAQLGLRALGVTDGCVSKKPGCLLRQRPDLGLLAVQGDAGDAGFQASFERLFAVMPPDAGQVADSGPLSIARVARCEYLICGRHAHIADLKAREHTSRGDVSCWILDITHGQAIFDLEGHRAHDILAASCGLDMRLGAFPVASATRTRFAHIPAYIERRGLEGFRLVVERPLAVYIRDWIETGMDALR